MIFLFEDGGGMRVGGMTVLRSRSHTVSELIKRRRERLWIQAGSGRNLLAGVFV